MSNESGRAESSSWTALRDLALCLSWANLCYLRIWSELLTYTEPDLFTMVSEPARSHYLAALAGMTGLGFAAWIVVTLARRAPHGWRWRALRWAAVVAMVIPLNALRIVASDQFPWLYAYLRQPLVGQVGVSGVAILAALLTAGALAVVWRFRKGLVRLPARVALVFVPLVPVTAGHALWYAFQSAARAESAAREERSTVPPAGIRHRHGPRVVWVLFDEWDYRLTFEARPAGLELPELDHWRRAALVATRAFPPSDQTIASVSALLTGMAVAGVTPVSRNQALLFPVEGGPPVAWSDAPNVFRDARQMDAPAAVVGWALPYCRLYGRELAACAWWETSIRRISKGDTIGPIAVAQWRSMVETAVLSPFGLSAVARDHYRTWRAMMDAAVRAAADPSLRLVFIHLPVPHAPYFYDRATGRFDRGNSLARGYLDHLVLVDHSVRRLRRALEEAGLLETTAVLLSSDHGFRSARGLGAEPDRRVPYLLRFGEAAVEYARPFNTLLTRELVRAILRGEVSDAAGAALWLDRQSHEEQSSRQISHRIPSAP
jgi:hypothetical protein